ncbi:MAG: hypothetical protein HY898_23955 [Deltaproteobacteria bacterium]|nr:hypothetical protein [Deltaproteobacteria bacterium]
MTSRTWIPAAVLIVVALLGPAAAQSRPSSRLSYSRGSGADHCPDEDAIRNAVAGRLGYSPFASGTTGKQISATIARDGKQLRARVEVRDEAGVVTGSREIVSDKNDCEELASSVTLAISIAIDPLSLTRPAPAASSSQPPPVTSAPPPPTAAPPVTVYVERPVAAPSAAPRSEPIRLRATAGLLTSLGTAPAPALGAAVYGGVRWAAMSVGIEGRADLPASKEQSTGGSVKSSLLAGLLVPCLHHGAAMGCALFALGALQGTGEQVSEPRKDTTPYAALGVRVAAELPMSPALAARINADLLGTLTRTTLRIDGAEAWTTPVIAGSLGVGVAGTF